MKIGRRTFIRGLSASPFLPSSAQASSVSPLRVVATNCRVGSRSLALPIGHNAFAFRTPHVIGSGAVSELALLLGNWASTASASGEQTNINPITYDALAIEIEGSSRPIAVTFQGQRSISVAGTQLVQSDPILAGALGFGSGAIPRDTKFWIRGRGGMVSGGTIFAGTAADLPGARFATFAAGSASLAMDVSGEMAGGSGQSRQAFAPGPVILGKFADHRSKSIIVIGDSIADGTGDVAPSPVIDGRGYFSRSTVNANGNKTIAMLHLTKPGDVAYGWAANMTMRSKYFQYCDLAVDELGVNDIGVAGAGRGAPLTLSANLQKIWAALKAAGIDRVFRTNFLPRTGPAGSPSPAMQSSYPGYNSACLVMDRIFETARSTGLLTGTFDVRSAVSLPSDHTLWGAGCTADGLHPSQDGHIAIARLMRHSLEALLV